MKEFHVLYNMRRADYKGEEMKYGMGLISINTNLLFLSTTTAGDTKRFLCQMARTHSRRVVYEHVQRNTAKQYSLTGVRREMVYLYCWCFILLLLLYTTLV